MSPIPKTGAEVAGSRPGLDRAWGARLKRAAPKGMGAAVGLRLECGEASVLGSSRRKVLPERGPWDRLRLLLKAWWHLPPSVVSPV